jgi:hypothetical protein
MKRTTIRKHLFWSWFNRVMPEDMASVVIIGGLCLAIVCAIVWYGTLLTLAIVAVRFLLGY